MEPHHWTVSKPHDEIPNRIQTKVGARGRRLVRQVRPQQQPVFVGGRLGRLRTIVRRYRQQFAAQVPPGRARFGLLFHCKCELCWYDEITTMFMWF